MGKLIEHLALKKGHRIVAKIQKTNGSWKECEKAHVIIDFSHPSCVLENLEKALNLKKPIVLGTTGWEEKRDVVKKMVEEKEGTLLYAPNFSLGVFFFLEIVKCAAKLSLSFPEYDICGMEMHHKQKQDAPSGTAKHILSLFKQAIPFSSIRLGSVYGKHTLVFDSFCDTITLTHEAKSREGFAEGAIAGAEWIIGKKGWLTLDEMLHSLHSTSDSI